LHVGQAASFLDSELANYRDLTGGAPCSPAWVCSRWNKISCLICALFV
jgi:hypothetical protein